MATTPTAARAPEANAPGAAPPARRVRSIGLLGGISPQSTQDYYAALVQRSIARLARDEYPRIVLISVNLAPYIEWARTARWDLVGANVEREIDALKAAGAEFAAICSNTTHRGLTEMGEPCLPLVHVIDAVAAEAKRKGCRTLALTGTGFLMRDGFYARGLRERGVETLLPTDDEQAEIHRIIFDELIRGEVRASSVASYLAIARRMLSAGADALLLGCTELAMPVAHESWPKDLPSLDSMEAHAEAIFEAAVTPAPSH